MMKEVKSSFQKRPVKLPPQQSETDTSNWEGRNVSAPTISKITKKRTVRELEFIQTEVDTSNLLTPAQAKKLEAQERAKKSSK